MTRVIQRVRRLGLVHDLVVATDSTMVARVAELSGVTAVMTREHVSGTDRVAEVAARPEFATHDVVVNIQGDEPFLPRAALEGALARVASGDDIGTAAAPLEAEAAADPARVKVVADAAGRALYFSRAPIPYRREGGKSPGADLYWQHLGVYAFQREALAQWTRLPPAPAEEAEKLEQLRALHYGMTIGVARLTNPAQPGVDTAEDLRRAEAHWFAQEALQ